jgi:hypothetical protein
VGRDQPGRVDGGQAVSRYGGEHQALRRAVTPYAVGSVCVRCGRPILPGQPWDLDHTDDGAGYLGASHRRCNRSVGGRLGAALQRAARKERTNVMLAECTLGVEIAEARDHVSVAAAGWIDGGFILAELAAYATGTDPVVEVLRLRGERTVTAVALDPRSPAATALGPLIAAGVEVTKLSTHDVAVAHGEFVDAVRAGVLRHTGQEQLTAAIRHGEQRRLGGATAWERRGLPVDVSPVLAAEVAVWMLRHAPAPIPRSKVW